MKRKFTIITRTPIARAKAWCTKSSTDTSQSGIAADRPGRAAFLSDHFGALFMAPIPAGAYRVDNQSGRDESRPYRFLVECQMAGFDALSI
jgi:hypothetical protein